MAHKRRLLARLQSRADVLQSEWLSQSTFSKPLANKQGAQVGNKHIAWPVLAILNSAKLKMTTKRKRTCISGSRVQRKRKKKKKKSHTNIFYWEPKPTQSNPRLERLHFLRGSHSKPQRRRILPRQPPVRQNAVALTTPQFQHIYMCPKQVENFNDPHTAPTAHLSSSRSRCTFVQPPRQTSGYKTQHSAVTKKHTQMCFGK